MKKLLSILALVATTSAALANNIQISNIVVTQPNITFDIKWDNSWNTTTNINPLYPNNWDGAWVFIKYQNNIDNLWKHATVSSVTGDHTISGGILEINPVADGMGVFIRRTAPGSGNLAVTTVTLKMNALIGTGNFNFKVFGTEVVYIPTGAFQLGDGNVSGASYYTPVDVTAARQTGGFTAGTLHGGSPAVPATFPMGYNALYMMKYEISNEQWVDLLNTLNYDQQVARTDVAPNGAINSQAYGNNVNMMVDNVIKILSPGLNNTVPATYGCDLDANNVYNENTDGQNIACGILSKADLFAYMDWSGLRPMTEFEFEKAARGPQARLLNEYAWGTATITPYSRIAGISGLGTPAEAVSGAVVGTGRAMANGGPGPNGGPGRSGIFATNATGRVAAGAGFWGNMELSGNLWEMCVSTDAAGVTFTGTNGNGQLTIAGEADVANWPNGALATAPSGTTTRGGSFYETASYTAFLATAYRNGNLPSGRFYIYGGRGARMAP